MGDLKQIMGEENQMNTISERGIEESMLVSVKSGEYKIKNPKTPDLKVSSAKGKMVHDMRNKNASTSSNKNIKVNNRKMSNDGNLSNTNNSDYFSASFHNTPSNPNNKLVNPTRSKNLNQ